MKLYLSDITNTVKYLIQKEVGKDQLEMYTSSVSRSMTFEMPVNAKALISQEFSILAEVVRFTNLDKGISVYTAVAMFLIWFGQTYMTSGKLKINIFDWPKLVGKVIGLVVEIVQIVKKETKDAILPAQS
jgi:hypothetical protein